VAIGFEHKIGKAPLSYYGYLDLKIINDSQDGFFDLEQLSFLQKEDFRASWKSDFGVRYYYNKNQRIKKGKNTNGFSSNYFSLSLLAYNPTSINNYWGLLSYEVSEEVLAAPFVGYGIQRRLGKIGFVDWSLQAAFPHLGISVSDVTGIGILNVKSTLRIGLGL
jgi:hypothetical protein